MNKWKPIQDSSRFSIIEQLDKGGFSVVYKAYDNDLGKVVALKQLNKAKYAKESFNEILIQKKLHSKYVSKIYDAVHDISHNIYYIVLEYCPYTLDALIKNNVLTVPQKIYIMHQILEGLSFLKEEEIVHLDIKPSNILITENMEAKISDFGVSCQYNPKYHGNSKVGTPTYKPIEMFFGKDTYSYEQDIWSCGVMFYEMMTGNQLFSKDNNLNSVFSGILGTLGYDDKNMHEFSNLPDFGILKNIMHCRPTIDSKFSDKIKENYGVIVDKVKLMVSISPSARPSASELLESGAFDSNDFIPRKLCFEEQHTKIFINEKTYKEVEEPKAIEKPFSIERPFSPIPLSCF